MSAREARALQRSPTVDCRGRLRSGLLREKTTDESETTMAAPGEDGNSPLPGSVSENREEDRVEDSEVQQEEEVVQDGRRNRSYVTRTACAHA